MDWMEAVSRMRNNIMEEDDPEVVENLRAIITGMTNFHLGIGNKLARERYEKYVKHCPNFIDEPIEDMRVEDKAVPELSGKTCSKCWCVQSYKLRQSIKKCECWK